MLVKVITYNDIHLSIDPKYLNVGVLFISECPLHCFILEKSVLVFVTRFGKSCLYARIIFFLIYLLKLSVTAYLSYGASFDATLAMVLTI